jgi:hypothetical protein
MSFVRLRLERFLVCWDAYKSVASLLLLLIFVAPFQTRFHGFFDSVSRALTLPDVPLPEFFSRKIHLFATDLLVIGLVLFLFLRFHISLRAFFWEGPSKYLTLLFFALLLSTGTSITKTYALQYFRLFQFSLVFLLFHSIKSIGHKIDLARLVYKIAWLLVGISLFESLLSICQYFSQGAVGLKFLGEVSPKKFPFVSAGEHLSLLGKLFGSRVNAVCLYRASGTFLHPNILGGFLFCAMMASYYLCLVLTGLKKRIFLGGVLFLQFFALCLTFSRSALLALGIASAVWCVLQLRNILHSEGFSSAAFKRFRLVACIGFCSILMGICLLYPQLKQRGAFFDDNHNTLIADTERVIYMKSAVEMIKKHPILGVGHNNFQIYIHQMQARFQDQPLHSKVHNIYLLITSEAGFMGGGLFFLFLIAVLRSSWQGIVGDKKKGAPEHCFQERAFLFCVF